MSLRFLPLCLSLLVGCQTFPARPSDSPADADEALQLAAGCIERGDEAGAVPHMLRHVEANPDQIMIRAYLAELLLRLDRLPEAQRHFERFVAEAQQTDGPARKQLIHCHTRLMEIAQDREDAYGERLHRGIGLLLLARQEQALGEAKEPAALRQQLLCKAAAELNEAHKARPDEARPSWYLFEVWSALNQSRPAEQALRQARDAAPFSTTLTPGERLGLAAVRYGAVSR